MPPRNPKNIIVILLLAVLTIAACSSPNRSEEAVAALSDELQDLTISDLDKVLERGGQCRAGQGVSRRYVPTPLRLGSMRMQTGGGWRLITQKKSLQRRRGIPSSKTGARQPQTCSYSPNCLHHTPRPTLISTSLWWKNKVSLINKV